jgi:polyferredoxin/tetratricopeptide (TPR) repeat protein
VARLPVIQEKRSPAGSGPGPIKSSRSAKWRVAILIAIHVLIAAHVAHWLATGSTVTPVEPSEAMAFSKAGVVNAGLIFFGVMIALTAIFGRFFCGWACHLVALQDLARWLLLKIGIRPRPLRSRALAVVPFLAFAYMFLWPLVYRLWHADPLGIRHVELTTSEFWSTFPGPVISLLTFLTCGFVIIYFLGAKGFCTYACPYGAIFAVADQVSPMRIRVTDACAGCSHCTAVCTSNIKVHEEVRDYGMVVSSGCMKCLDCVSVCPNDALYYGFGPIPLLAAPRVANPAKKSGLPWLHEGLLAGFFVIGFLTFRGLYGAIPFLMALGTAAILAFLALIGFQLLTKTEVSHLHLGLKRHGRLTRAGSIVGAGMALLLVFWIHSAAIRWQTWSGDRLFRQTEAMRQAALDAVEAPNPLASSDRILLRTALERFAWVERWGLFPTAGLATRQAELALVLGDSAALRLAAAVALERDENRPRVERLVAREARRRGDLVAAAQALARAINAFPSDPEPYVELGILQAQVGDLQGASETFARGRELARPSPQLFYSAGLVAAWSGDAFLAVELFESTLALAPRHLEARENLAGVLAGLGRFAESSAQYRLALETNSSDPLTYVLWAKTLIALGQEASARSALEQALRLAPELDEARSLLDDLSKSP